MFFLVEFWSWTLCTGVVLVIRPLLGCCILEETSQKIYVPVTKISQVKAWISLKKASFAPQSKWCCLFSNLKLIIFRNIIQFLFVLFPLLLCFHQHLLYMKKSHDYHMIMDVKERFFLRSHSSKYLWVLISPHSSYLSIYLSIYRRTN